MVGIFFDQVLVVAYQVADNGQDDDPDTGSKASVNDKRTERHSGQSGWK